MSAVKEEETAAAASSDVAREEAPQYPLGAGIEALLISSDRPLTEARLGELLGLNAADRKTAGVRAAIDELNKTYAAERRAFTIERLAGGWQILTRPEYGPLLAQLHRDRAQGRLSQAALETLAIISYRQPIMRAEIEAIRGVACGEVLRGLLERRLVKIVGRAEELGRPMLYGTTREFLKVFGIASADDLPVIEGLETGPAQKKKRPKAKAAPGVADTGGASAGSDTTNTADSTEAADTADSTEAADAADSTEAADAADSTEAAEATDAIDLMEESGDR